MSDTKNLTTLVSLFHTPDHAQKAVADLHEAGIPASAIQTLGGSTQKSTPEQSLSTLEQLDIPDRDQQVLASGIEDGGVLVIVSADETFADEATSVLERYVRQIDERTSSPAPMAAAAVATDSMVIPVVEESLAIGKRQVERGGVRVFSRIVETPVEEQITLREERAVIDRQTVNRPISTAELDSFQNQTLEVRETGEEAVVGKTARVVEEVSIGKETTQRTQQIKDTLRRTEVEVDEILPEESGKYQPKG